MQAQGAWFLGTQLIRKLVLEGPTGQGSHTRSWRALRSEEQLEVRGRQPHRQLLPRSEERVLNLPVHLHHQGVLAPADGTAGGGGCAPGVGLTATLAGVLRRSHVACAGSAPPRLLVQVPSLLGMELSVFSIPCLFINVNYNYISAWYASNFHFQSDLYLMKASTAWSPGPPSPLPHCPLLAAAGGAAPLPAAGRCSAGPSGRLQINLHPCLSSSAPRHNAKWMLSV